jgi:hypothetical protein
MAITRGLKEYLESLGTIAVGGRNIEFANFFDVWAEHEEDAIYPSATIYSDVQGVYDASSLSPSISGRLPAPDDNVYLVKLAEFRTELKVDIWTTDPAERSEFARLFEDQLNPCEWMYGFMLDLPHYYGARAKFASLGSTYIDSAESSMQRRRIVSFAIFATVPQYKLVTKPMARPQLRLTVTETEIT